MFRLFRKKHTNNGSEHVPTSKQILHQLYDWADERDYAAIEEYLTKLDEEDYIPAIMGICFSFLYNVEYEFPYERAQFYLDKIRDTMKNSASWHYSMAYALLYQKKYEEARLAACKGTLVAPDCAYLWLIYSKALYCLGDKDNAGKVARCPDGWRGNEELLEWIKFMEQDLPPEGVLDEELPYAKASNNFTMPDEMRARVSESS